MKKVFVLCTLVCVCLAAMAQQVPNKSFYYWANTLNPNGWGTWASAISPHNQYLADSAVNLAQRDTTAGYYPGDTSTLRLSVDTLRLPGYGRVTLSGFAALGGATYSAPPTGYGLQMGYMAYTRKPDTLYLDYKMTRPAGATDMPVISIGLTHWDTLSHSRLELLSEAFTLQPDSAWQYNVAIPLTNSYNAYPDSIAPDSLQLIFFASGATHPTIGTTLWLDSVRFDASVDPATTTGLPDLSAIRSVAIWPNPTADLLYIGLEEKELGDQLELYDATGRRVYQGPLPDRINTIPTDALPPGDYSLRIHSRDGLTTFRSQVAIVR